MEFLQGGPLSDILMYEQDNGIVVPIERTCQRFQDMVNAVCYIHSVGVVHCDIK